MLLSTAIPIVIAAIVIVIISKGISSKPIIPKIKKAAIKLGTMPIKEIVIFLKSKKINHFLRSHSDKDGPISPGLEKIQS